MTRFARIGLLAAGLAAAGLNAATRTLWPWETARIAVVPVDGEIDDSEPTVRALQRLGEATPGVRAVVISLNTPGGGVAAAQEICQEIHRLRSDDGIKVVAAMGGMAASGGYYVASACDLVVADPGTVTGSIGVILEAFEARRLLDKVGVSSEVIKSGEFKDAGSPFRPMTPRDRAVFQSTVDDVYDQFVGDVVRGRRGPLARAVARETGESPADVTDPVLRAYVRRLGDGRVYTGRQAQRLGLVDRLGGLQDAIDAAAGLCGLEHPEVVTLRRRKSLAEIVTGLAPAQWGAWARGLWDGEAPTVRYLMR